jgi:hypothetical protein
MGEECQNSQNLRRMGESTYRVDEGRKEAQVKTVTVELL